MDAVDKTDSYNNIEYPRANYKMNMESAPMNFIGSETVYPDRGDIENTVTDISLKGRNGLDLNLTMY